MKCLKENVLMLFIHLVKQKAQLSLRLSNPLTEAIGTFPHEERHLSFAHTAFVGQRSSYQRFPSARGTVK